MSADLRGQEKRTRSGVPCAGCGFFFFADVNGVMTDEGPKALCWICRHAVVRHDIPFALVSTLSYKSYTVEATGETAVEWSNGRVCMCGKHEFYPADVLAEREEKFRAMRLTSAA